MTNVRRSERVIQGRVASWFTDSSHVDWLGYSYLDEWSKREINHRIEVDLLRENLTARGCSAAHLSAALRKLEVAG